MILNSLGRNPKGILMLYTVTTSIWCLQQDSIFCWWRKKTAVCSSQFCISVCLSLYSVSQYALVYTFVKIGIMAISALVKLY